MTGILMEAALSLFSAGVVLVCFSAATIAVILILGGLR